jgi:hypothetical protein
LAGKLAETPMVKYALKIWDNDHFYENVTHYKKLVGKLIYLTNISPDIQFVVQ